MPNAVVTLPDGRRAQVSFDSQEQLDATVNDLVAHSAPAQPQPERPIQRGDVQPVGDIGTAIAEPLTSMATAAVATPVAGLAGLGTAAAKAAGLTDREPADVVHSVQEAMTYQPRTKAGQIANSVVNFPFQKLAEGADYVGGKVADATGSPALGAATNTLLQAAPALLTRRVSKGAPAAASELSLAEDAPRPAQQPTAAAEPAPSVAQLQPRIAPAAEPEPVAPDLVLETRVQSPQKVNTKPTPEVRAQEYASSIGLDWSALSRQVQATLTDVANDSKQLAKLDPGAVARQARLESLPVPVPSTQGILTRDPVQLRNEGNVAATDAGKPIRDTHLDANQALLDNLDLLRGRVANRRNGATTPEQVGISVQDQALRAKLALKRDQVKAKYKAAEEAGELQGKVSPREIIKTIYASPDKTHFGWVQSWLSEMEVVKKTENGTITRKLTLKEMEDLRQAAVARAMDGGTEGYYAGKIISAIDNATEGAGGAKYQEARAARREQALEFEETGAIARLVENKSRTDRATALEDTWRKTVIGGSIQDLRNVKRSLLTGGDASTRTAGKVAWRDLKAQTIQHIRDEATKGVAPNERGQPNITPAAMKRAIDSVGRPKLEEIFGVGTAARLDQILQATRDVKTVPAPIHAGSSTMGNVLAFLEKGLGKIPVIGNTASGVITAGVKLNEMGAASKTVRQSQNLPLKPKPEKQFRPY